MLITDKGKEIFENTVTEKSINLIFEALSTSEKKSVLLVPNRALKNVGTRKAVHVVGPGAPGDVIVEAGSTDGNETEIVSGLSEGVQVQLN